MHIMNVYYKHYEENCTKNYWDLEEKVLPYMVLICNKEEREAFRQFLESENFVCVTWNSLYPGVLVNMQFRRFALIHRPCHFSCVNDRDYSVDSFMNEVYNTKNDSAPEC